MTRALAIATIAFSIGCQAPALAQSAGPDLVKRAVAAAGGEQALRGLKSLQITGEAKHWEPDQSVIPGGPVMFIGDSKFTLTWDLANDAARTSWDRVMQGRGTLKYDEVVTPKFGFVSDEAGSRAMSAIRVAAQLRELHRIAPNLLLKMLDNPGRTTFEGGVRTGEGIQPGVSFKDGATTFTVVFNKKTQLPGVIRTHDDDSVRGTVTYDVRFDDWKPVGGVMIAHSLIYMLGDTAIARLRYAEVKANPPIDATVFAPSNDVKAALKAPAAANVPYQWVLRRLNFGQFLDSDQVFVPPGGSLKLVELAPNVQQVVGGSHNSLIVAMKDGPVVIDAPINADQSRWTIDAARAKYGKPVSYLVLTHHHSDHSGGVRTYMGEGVKILVPNPAKKYFVKLALAEHMVPDDVQKKHISPDVTEIRDEMTLKDGTTELRLVRIANHHAEGMLIAHIMPANIVWVTDLWSPGSETAKTPGTLALSDALKRLNITEATVAGGHGTTAPQSALDAIVATKQSAQ
jgi:glyoxylase-like metal-dependent hydrolase (beta-lactamase superfamily II)